MRLHLLVAGVLAATAVNLVACGGGTAAAVSPTAPTAAVVTTPTSTPTPTAPATPTSAQAMYAQFGNGVTVTFDGSSVVLKTTDVPDHKSPYFGVGNANYEAPRAGMQVNPEPHCGAEPHLPRARLTGVGRGERYAARAHRRRRQRRGPVQPVRRGPPAAHDGNRVVRSIQRPSQPDQSVPLSLRAGVADLVQPQPPARRAARRLPAVRTDRRRWAHADRPGFLSWSRGRHRRSSPAGIYHYHTSTDVPYISGCFRGPAGTVS